MNEIDQNTIEDGETIYKSQKSDGSCKGCAFDSNDEHYRNPNGFLMCKFPVAPCVPSERTDKNHVIFIKVKNV